MSNTILKTKTASRGVTLVEILIATSLMALMMMALFMGIFKMKASAGASGLRSQAGLEVLSLYFRMRGEIASSSGIEDRSLSNRIILSNLDDNGVPFLTGYRNVGGNLQTATTLTSPSDNTASKWISPYNITADNKYSVGSAEFLYCGYGSMANCTRFTDTNSNGVFDYGTDSATTPLGGGTPLRRPSEARRVLLRNFTFDRQVGRPAVKRVMPDTYVAVGSRLVDMGNVSGANVHQSYSNTNSTNPVFPTNYVNPTTYQGYVKTITYDQERRRMIHSVDFSTGDSRIIITDREGAPIRDVSNGLNYDLTTTGWSSSFDSISIAANGTDLYALDNAGRKLVRINLKTGSTSQLLDFTNAAFTSYIDGTKLYAIYYDAMFPTNIYLLARNPSNQLRLYRINLSTPGAALATFNMPAGLTGTKFQMFRDPVKGSGTESSMEFFITQNVTTGYLDVYRVKLSSPTTTDMFQVNLTGSGMYTTGTNNQYGVTYDFDSNHLFVSDWFHASNRRTYEIVPPRILSPRS